VNCMDDLIPHIVTLLRQTPRFGASSKLMRKFLSHLQGMLTICFGYAGRTRTARRWLPQEPQDYDRRHRAAQTSLRAIAVGLNERRIPTARSGEWHRRPLGAGG
jgi:hypothetical protein